MENGITPRAIYFDIERIAMKGRNPDQARLRIYQFKADVAAADLEFGRTAELHDQLRRMLIIASKRHRVADVSIFKEAIDALNRDARLEAWEE